MAEHRAGDAGGAHRLTVPAEVDQAARESGIRADRAVAGGRAGAAQVRADEAQKSLSKSSKPAKNGKI